MSYILDALNKAERERQQGSVPSLQTPVLPATATSTKHGGWLVLGGLLLLCVGLGAGMVFSQRDHDASLAANPTPPSQAATTQYPVKLASQAPGPLPATAPSKQPKQAPDTPPHGAVTSGQLAAAVEASTSSQTKQHATTIEADIPSIDSLPGELRQSIPAMSVLIHAYSSEPQSRMVIINNKPLHEGDTLAPGLVLERIEPDGMVFNLHGTRFRTGTHG